MCLELLKKEKYHQQKFYTLKLFRHVDHLYKSEMKVVLMPILMELQMFDHLKQFFVYDFEDSF